MSTGPPFRVLHVDDEPGFSEVVEMHLEREHEGLDVVTEHTAEAGLERLQSEDIDCVVSDFDMPDTDGLAFLESVRETYPDLPFILFTGKGSEEIASRAISAGVTDYIQKTTKGDQFAVLANRIENAVERYRSQRELEASERRLSMLVDQSPLGVLEWNEDFEFTRANATARDLLGYDEGELLGKTWRDIVSESDRDRVAAVVEQVLADEGGYHSINENVTADGEVMICEWYNRVVTDADGEVVVGISMFQDITERRENRRRLETLIRNLPGMVYRCRNDPGWPMSFVSGECEQLTGHPPSALSEGTVSYGEDIIHPEDRDDVWQGVQSALAAGEPFELTYRIVTAGGATRWVWERGRAIDDDGTLEGFITDITARKEYERRLNRQLERFEEFGRVLGRDLRAPLSTIGERLDRAATTGDPDHIEAARESLDRVDRFVEELATVMRQGTLASDTEPVDVGEALRSVFDRTDTGDATLDVVDPPRIRADPDALAGLLEALVDNARQHAGPDVTVRCGAFASGFYVADDGPGIPPGDRDRVFQPGYTTGEDGTGLGLTGVRQIALAHGWSVSLTDSDGGGARFEFTTADR